MRMERFVFPTFSAFGIKTLPACVVAWYIYVFLPLSLLLIPHTFHLILLKTFAYFPKKLYLCTRNVSHISANNRNEQ